MNESTSWDPSLVKKFSSSNHYKLLNQLRNEVKKYPLNNKKKPLSNQITDPNNDNKNKSNISQKQISTLSNNSYNINEDNANRSTVSFNNSKNFSIYNQMTNNNINQQNDSFLTDQSRLNEVHSSPTFKERLNQIDMK